MRYTGVDFEWKDLRLDLYSVFGALVLSWVCTALLRKLSEKRISSASLTQQARPEFPVSST